MKMNVDKLVKKKQHAKRDGNLRQLADISKALGDMYFETEQSTKALQEYTDQLNICEGLQDKLNGAIAHRMIGEVYASLGDYEQALIHQNLHLEGAKEMRNSTEEQRAFATLGRTYFCLAESLTSGSSGYVEALANAKLSYVKSMELCDQLTSREINTEEKLLMRARLLLNLGLTLEAQKEIQQAIDLIEQATKLCVSNNFQEDLHRACISLAGIHERQGNHELTLNYIETAGTVNDARLKAEAGVFKAEFFMRSGRWIEARKVLISLYTSNGLPKNTIRWVEKYLRIIVTICRAENDLLVEMDVGAKQKLYEILGDASVAVQCFDKGVEYYRYMLTCAEETGREIDVSLVSLVQTLKDAKRYEEALPFAQRELALCTNPREKCRSALFLADLSVERNAAETEIREYYAVALNSARESEDNDVKLQKSVTREFVSYLENIGEFDEARDVKEKAGLSAEGFSDSDSSDSEASSNDSDKIGADICLEDLSDLENEETCVRGTNVIGKRKRTRATRTSAIKRNRKGETPLHIACINGDISAVERLLSSGHSVNVQDYYGWSPLHEAANHGHVDIAELLLKHGANVNDRCGKRCKGMTPLHDAAYCGHLAMMQLLMEHGADLTLKTHDGDTVLDCLEDCRERVEDLSPEALVEYETMHKKLSAIFPTRKKRKKEEERDTSVRTRDETSPREQQPRVHVSAGEDYKRTIASLRNFNKVANRTAAACKKRSDESRAPLINEEEILVNDDDWLEDDIGRQGTVKKRGSSGHVERRRDDSTTKRRSADGNVMESERVTKKLRLNAETTLRAKKEACDTSKDSNDDNSGKDDDDDDDDDAIEIVQKTFQKDAKRSRRKRQTCLMSNGFTVSRSPSPAIDSIESSPLYGNNATTSLKEYVHLRARVKETMLELKVEMICEEEQSEFLTRVTNAAECAFLRETGCTAKLLLQPTNVTMTAILRIARENDKIECEIVDLQIPPIVERYKTICLTYNTAVSEVALKCLKSCENTSVFRVKSEYDTNRELLVPLLKTLAYERNVKLLQLSGTTLLTAGTHLDQCLSNLSCLQELYLKGCDIDFACLRQINSLPPQLRILDMSHNPLSSKSCDTLRKLIAPLRYLQTLDLRYCELQDFSLPLDNPNLTNCDVSWNRLNRDAATSLLRRQLFDLNLSNTVVGCRDRSANSSWDAILSPSLESLDLSFCELTDADVMIILAQLPRLLKLILCGNPNVSVLSVNALLRRQPTLSRIDVSGCQSITSNPETELFIQNPEVCTLLVSMEPDLCDEWIKLWRDTAIVTRLPHNLAIFRPI